MTWDDVVVTHTFDPDVAIGATPELIDICLSEGCEPHPDETDHGFSFTVDGPEFQTASKQECIDTIERKGRGTVRLYHGEVKFLMSIYLENEDGGLSELPNVSFSCASGYLRNDTTSEETVNTIIKLSKAFHQFGAIYVFGDMDVLANKQPSADSIRDGRVEHLYWINLFSAEMADNIGRDRLLSAPAWKVEVLPDESVLFVVKPNRYDGPEPRYTLEAASEHIGIEAISADLGEE